MAKIFYEFIYLCIIGGIVWTAFHVLLNTIWDIRNSQQLNNESEED